MMDEPSEGRFVVRDEPAAVEQILGDQDENAETERADSACENEHPTRRTDVRT